MRTVEIEIAKLSPPPTRDVADVSKLERYGKFDRNKYTPIAVAKRGDRYVIIEGMTRTELARRAGIKTLPAYVFEKE